MLTIYKLNEVLEINVNHTMSKTSNIQAFLIPINNQTKRYIDFIKLVWNWNYLTYQEQKKIICKHLDLTKYFLDRGMQKFDSYDKKSKFFPLKKDVRIE